MRLISTSRIYQSIDPRATKASPIKMKMSHNFYANTINNKYIYNSCLVDFLGIEDIKQCSAMACALVYV